MEEGEQEKVVAWKATTTTTTTPLSRVDGELLTVGQQTTQKNVKKFHQQTTPTSPSIGAQRHVVMASPTRAPKRRATFESTATSTATDAPHGPNN